MNPNPPDITKVLGDINSLLDDSITGHAIREQGPPALDLSKINFEALASKFKQSKHKNTDLEVLKAAIRTAGEDDSMNRTRADFAEKFEELIESYNAGSRTIETLYQELLRTEQQHGFEEQRHVRENNISEEELVIFDILTRPSPELGAERTCSSEKGCAGATGTSKRIAGSELATKN